MKTKMKTKKVKSQRINRHKKIKNKSVIPNKRKLINSLVAQLAEHFETVQVIVTNTYGEDGTSLLHAGKGNFYARKASLEEWLMCENEKSVRSMNVDDDDKMEPLY